jgi:hypothetical protein
VCNCEVLDELTRPSSEEEEGYDILASAVGVEAENELREAAQSLLPLLIYAYADIGLFKIVKEINVRMRAKYTAA